MRLAAVALLAGCAEGPAAPCEVVGEPVLELAPADVAFEDFADGDPLPCGDPPQGGAPYTPLRARVSGLTDLHEGVTVALYGVDTADGADLGEVSYTTRLVCANVGESAGTWLAADLHFRYFGWLLDDLPGRVAEITVVVTDVDGAGVEASVRGPLEAM